MGNHNEIQFSDGAGASRIAERGEVISQRVAEQFNGAQFAAAHDFSSAQRTVDEIFGTPTVVGTDGTKYLQGHISNVPEISPGISNIEDLKASGLGIARGAGHFVESTAKFLAQPGAVDKSLLAIGPALDMAVDYYSRTPFTEVRKDARTGLAAFADLIVEKFGHPMQPAQRGENDGFAMAMAMPFGKKLPGEKLEELATEGTEIAADYAQVQKLTMEELELENFQVFEARKFMKDGKMTVDIDYIIQPDGLPRPNMFKLFNQIERMANAEGASELTVRATELNPRLFRILRERFGFQLDPNGISESITKRVK